MPTVNITTKMLNHMKIAIPILHQIIVHTLTNNTVHPTTIVHTRITIKKITQKNILNQTTTITIRAATFYHI